MKQLLFFISLTVAVTAFGQFSIGTRTVTFNDATRTGGFGSGGGAGRQIQCEVYYPATAAGANATFATGKFPVIVFGHGFAMSWDAYSNIWEELVPLGYIMVFPRTEGGLFPTPNHENFGKDLKLVEQRMVAEGNLSTSPFYNKLTNKNAIMGHSMGGGATFLAGASNTSIQTIIGLAPAETTPSAITAAASVSVPTLILSGGADGVTPPVDHHIPIYNAVTSACKTMVTITGGAHCYFANSNFNCDFGEGTSSTNISITRAEQQTAMFTLIKPWLAFYLKGECSGFSDFETALTSTLITNQRTCSYTPYSVSGIVTDAVPSVNGSIALTVTGGLAPFTYSWSTNATTQNVTNLTAGTYTVSVSDTYCTTQQTYTIANTNTSSIGSFDAVEVFVFPNPTSGDVMLQFSEFMDQGVVVIYDFMGKIVKTITLHSNEKELKLALNSVANGVYFIQLQTEAGNSAPLKVSKI